MRLYLSPLIICLGLFILLPSADCARVEIVKTPPMEGSNSYYAGNRAPLKPIPLIKLPLGAVQPEGWLRNQLELMADGMTGRLPELTDSCNFELSAWTKPNGRGSDPWENAPYWLKGYISLGYVLNDKRIIANANRWVSAILATQREDGYFGTEQNADQKDLWPNMNVLYALRSYYEVTGDKRVITFMTRYFRWQSKIPKKKFLSESYAKVRGGENLNSIYWLYNRTGEKWLLDLARVNHWQVSDWTNSIVSWHGVDFTQCFREPAEYYQQSKNTRYLKATIRNLNTVTDAYGQLPGGMFGADEYCRPGYTGPRQGTETCAMVEMMHSCEILSGITGDSRWADRCEDVAFNSLPAAFTPDMKGLRYFTAPNMPQSDKASKEGMFGEGCDMLSYAPTTHHCCDHNSGQGWPYFTEHLWMATLDNGIAAVLYAPNKVTAHVSGGASVSITESTDYPFRESISFTVNPSRSVRFPLYLRIPGWCGKPKIVINNKPAAVKGSGGWVVLNRVWQKGDRVVLHLPMDLRVKTWQKNRNTVSVYRGPLAYSLKIGEQWKRIPPEDPGEGEEAKLDNLSWPRDEVFPTTPWNYGLVLNSKNPAASLQVIQHGVKEQPFTLQNPPVEIRAKGKRIPQWKFESNGLIMEVKQGPVRSEEPEETITLIPMGCARLRISSFPQIGEGASAATW